jgi:hypothetical protein
MSTIRIHALIATFLLASAVSFADTKAAPPTPKASPMSKETRMMVIRSLNAEMVFVRVPMPRGEKGMSIKNGVVSPGDQDLRMALAQYGFAARPGDRARITDVEIKGDHIHFEINGGAKQKKKWYQRIEVGGMGGMTPVAPDNDDPNAHRGTSIDLVFDRYVPELTGDQIRQMLAPLLDFHAKSAAEAFMETVPPKVKEAIKNHEVLVGMNREMVGYAKGRPGQKIREKDELGKEYEDWIYGQPPEQVDFVRFMGDEVVRIEQMKVDGTKLVRNDKEVDIAPTGVTLAQKEKQAEEKAHPQKAPSLRRPGEKPELNSPDSGGRGPMPRPTGTDTSPGPPQQGPVPPGD